MALVAQDSLLYNGAQYEPGESLPDSAPPELIADLIERGLLGEGAPSVEVPVVESVAPDEGVTDRGPDLSRLNKAQLSAVAAEAGLDVPDGATKKKILVLLQG